MPKIHVVKQGECLASIAEHYKFTDWRAIYNHSENADFKRSRPNPNLIQPNDRLFIPDITIKEHDGNTNQKHTYILHRKRVLLRIVLKDLSNQACSSKKYKLLVEGKVYQGTTNGEGLIEHEIPARAENAELTAWIDLDQNNFDKEYTWTLKIGHLDPINAISGVQARLKNLGFRCGKSDGIIGPKTKHALRTFQTKAGLEPDGIIGEKTRKALLDAHGC